MPFQRPVRPEKMSSRASRSALASGSMPDAFPVGGPPILRMLPERMDDGVSGEGTQEEQGQADQKAAKRHDAHGP